MGIRNYKPTSPGRRGASGADFVEVTKSTPEKSLLGPTPKSGGRNVHGRITSRHRGGGDVVESGEGADIKPGNALPLRSIPVGTLVHAVELRPGGGAKMGRSAGVAIQLLAKEGGRATLRMPSGEIRQVEVTCRATVGEVGNSGHDLITWGKAGRSRHKGRRPQTRGVAMNPVDHPLGGGEGKSSGGRHPVSPWGKPEGRTRRRNKPSDKMILRRRGKGRGR